MIPPHIYIYIYVYIYTRARVRKLDTDESRETRERTTRYNREATMVKKRDKRNQAKKRKIHICHHHACHSNLKKSKAMKAHNLARHENSTKHCNTCMRNCFQTREGAGDARRAERHAKEELRSFSKVQNLRHVLRRRRTRVPFLRWIGGRTG